MLHNRTDAGRGEKLTIDADPPPPLLPGTIIGEYQMQLLYPSSSFLSSVVVDRTKSARRVALANAKLIFEEFLSC